MSRFNGKVAVITGGNSGIGLATAKELIASGARVVIAGRDQKTLDDAVETLGENALGIKTDVTSSNELTALFEKANERFGKVDILFVNAGIAKFAPLEQSDEALFDEIVNINFKGSYFTVKYALPFLNDGASIIFTTTVAAKVGMAGASIYAASKSAIHSLGNSFSEEEIYEDFSVLFRKYVRRNRKILGDFFINEASSSVHKLCDDFEKYIYRKEVE